MSKDIEKSLWVNSVSPEEIDGETYIPTEICYLGNNNILTGKQAYKASLDGKQVNMNFKLNLGKIKPGGSIDTREKHKCEDGKDRGTYEICKDYFESVLSNIEDKIPRVEEGLPKLSAKIIVAEPLAFQIEKLGNAWISNYRENIRRILSNYEEVAFLPEPFAVYQHYRYGIKINSLQEKKKQIALIVDFGGGTFDACVIESTESGDVSRSGKHSKPLAADSVPVGGFYINRCLAHYLLKRDLEHNSDKQAADKALKQIQRIENPNDSLELEVLSDRSKSYINNIFKLMVVTRLLIKK